MDVNGDCIVFPCQKIAARLSIEVALERSGCLVTFDLGGVSQNFEAV